MYTPNVRVYSHTITCDKRGVSDFRWIDGEDLGQVDLGDLFKIIGTSLGVKLHMHNLSLPFDKKAPNLHPLAHGLG